MNDGFEAALDDFKGEAKIWDGISDDLAKAAGAVSGLTLDSTAFKSGGDGAARSYESVRSAVEKLLRGGATETAGAAQALRQAKDLYQKEEDAILARANKLVGQLNLLGS